MQSEVKCQVSSARCQERLKCVAKREMLCIYAHINRYRSFAIMPLFDTDDGLTVHREGSSTRARSGNLNFLFRDSTPETIIETYIQFVAAAREFFGKRRHSFKGPNIAEDDFRYLTQKTTLR